MIDFSGGHHLRVAQRDGHRDGHLPGIGDTDRHVCAPDLCPSWLGNGQVRLRAWFDTWLVVMAFDATGPPPPLPPSP